MSSNSDHPGHSNRPLSTKSISRLGGLTNENYVLTADDRKYVLRLPGVGTSEYISRTDECTAALVTAKIGVNVPVLFFDEKSGLQLASFMPGKTLSEEGFKDKGVIARAADTFRRLHTSNEKFASEFNVFAMISRYLEVIDSKKIAVPDGYKEALAKSDVIKEGLARHPNPIVPCHCDPLAENFIDTGARVYLIDWEYAGNNDPMWDLADLIVEANFESWQQDHLLFSYFNGNVPVVQKSRMMMYRALCDLLWTLWGMIQFANKNPADDFWAYATMRLQRYQKLIATKEFDQALLAL